MWKAVRERVTLSCDGDRASRGGDGCCPIGEQGAGRLDGCPGDARRARPARRPGHRSGCPRWPVSSGSRRARSTASATSSSSVAGRCARATGRSISGSGALRLGSRAEALPIVIGFRSVAAQFLTLSRRDDRAGRAGRDQSIYVAIEETSHPSASSRTSGSTTPAFASASGRVVLASLPAETMQAHVRRTGCSSRRRAGG